MILLKRTNSEDSDLPLLIKQLDKELAVTDGEDHAFYNQFNKLDKIRYAVIIYEEAEPAGCGAIKEFQPGIMEVKRMFTQRQSRGKGYASKILNELENWAGELGYEKCILETGINQPEAIALYKKNGYQLIANYGQYAGVEKSFCFGKLLNKQS
ncbi:GNAT family N-acetyltransferase [Gillisia limnaea]|uniref:GCN5-related N-acetyltransferase n=1 Tax=Gillisia limnaea (strain DSM 15749 / LMG 21470 / R-8282) TaxID=865937 RepID=H2BU58_GILLR|nr:GNAT family N-acetyltransferase [Gillisia limnaea]EHQ01654.1 GCN5-related N-acetyltransferase [Gillisia limnaea DSM 15749]